MNRKEREEYSLDRLNMLLMIDTWSEGVFDFDELSYVVDDILGLPLGLGEIDSTKRG